MFPMHAEDTEYWFNKYESKGSINDFWWDPPDGDACWGGYCIDSWFGDPSSYGDQEEGNGAGGGHSEMSVCYDDALDGDAGDSDEDPDDDEVDEENYEEEYEAEVDEEADTVDYDVDEDPI